MSDFDKQEKRIAEVFAGSEVPSISSDTLATYLDYLKKNVELPCRITGIEDMGYFGREEYYTFGPGSEREHKRLRKTQASFMDTFDLIDFNDDVYEEGIVVNVKRVSDKRKFVIPLADLEAEDKELCGTADADAVESVGAQLDPLDAEMVDDRCRAIHGRIHIFG